MDRDYFHQAFEYNQYANRTIIDPYLKLSSIPEKARSIISHLLQAQNIWVSRINPAYSSSGDPWAELAPETWLSVHERSYEAIKEIIGDNEGQYHKVISYQNSKGYSFTNEIGEILHHLLFHGAYHRGQLAMLLRHSGEQPPVTDYIFYLRE